MNRLTFSGLHRARACLASVVLPQVHAEPTAMTSTGTAIHAFLARVVEVGRDDALEEVPMEHRRACELLELDSLPVDATAWSHEVAMAFEPFTGEGRLLPTASHRDYSAATEAEICGTADVCGVAADSVVVLDYKIGWQDLGPVADNLQLLAAAVTLARIHGKRSATVGIVRIRDDGSSWTETAQVDEAGLDVAAYELLSVAMAARESAGVERPAEPTEGPHCRYCKSYNYCPAKMRLAAALGAGTLEVPPLTEETAPLAYAVLTSAQDVLDRVAASLKEWAREHPIQLPGGVVYGPKEHPTEKIRDVGAAKALLSELYGPLVAVASEEVRVTMSKDALKAALRTHYVAATPGAKITATFNSAMAALRERGIATTTTEVRVMEHRPKQGKPEPS